MSLAAREPNAGRLTLPASLDIEHCAAVRELLLSCIDEPAVAVDAGAVERTHTASLQLLCMFWRGRNAAGHATHWQDTSASLRGAAALLGVTGLLNLEPATP